MTGCSNFTKMGGVKIQIVTVAILASVMAQANCEFYGIEFGKPSGISTNVRGGIRGMEGATNEDGRPLTMWYGKWYYIGVSKFKEGLCPL